GLQSQRDYFAQHARAVVNHLDRAAFGMVPTRRNFAQPQCSAMGEKKKFDIKREPNRMRLFQNWPANIEPKGFETALRVPERQPSRESHDQVEHATGLLRRPRLPNTE